MIGDLCLQSTRRFVAPISERDQSDEWFDDFLGNSRHLYANRAHVMMVIHSGILRRESTSGARFAVRVNLTAGAFSEKE
jgi:hypothetical protein